MPFFSVIIPSYNRAHLIAQTIKSVQRQTFENWECLIIDDGSKDHTKEVISEIAKLDKRIKYIYQDNAERSGARNKGINNAKGEYICFLDSDDTYLENHLEIVHENIKNKNFPEALFFTNHNLVEEHKIIQHDIPNLGDDAITYLAFNPIIPARVCIHHAILKKLQFDEDIVIVEDLILWLRIAFEYPLFQITERTVNYLIHADNSINLKNNSAQKRLNGLKTFCKKYPKLKSKIPLSLLNFLIGDTHFGLAKYYIYRNHNFRAIKHLLYSIAYQKFHNQLKHKFYLLFQLLIGKKINL